MHVTWHGHSTWQVSVGSTTFLIDPFFDNPLTSMSIEDLDVPEYLLVTHGHADHVGDVGAVADRTTVVGTPELTAWVGEEHGAAETIGMNLGGTVDCGDASVTMVQAMHSNSIESDYQREIGVPAGFIISEGAPDAVTDPDTLSLYHTGDTSLMSEMRDVIGAFLQPDAAAVPIGDHFTMGPEQAATAVEWIGASEVFPMHYDTFPLVEQDPVAFVDAVEATGSDATVTVLEADETYEL